MELKFYIRHKAKSYKVLKLRQGAKFDITIIPNNAVVYSRTILDNLNIGDSVEVKYETIGAKTIDHFSAHARSGQRHLKLRNEPYAFEPMLDLESEFSKSIVPLITMVASVGVCTPEEPNGKTWLGFELPDDVNYVIIDLFTAPKDSIVQFNGGGFTIKNEKATKEGFGNQSAELRNCTLMAFIRYTNHESTDIPNNIVFQQGNGKAIIITRVKKGKVLTQIGKIESGRVG
jgi:hypothetical protein